MIVCRYSNLGYDMGMEAMMQQQQQQTPQRPNNNYGYMHHPGMNHQLSPGMVEQQQQPQPDKPNNYVNNQQQQQIHRQTPNYNDYMGRQQSSSVNNGMPMPGQRFVFVVISYRSNWFYH